jgi:methionyl-tRNA formyltransferase
VAMVAAGDPPRVPQDESRASYDPLLTDAHAAIDWTAATATVHDLIRGCDPQPGAHTTAAGTLVRLYEPRRVPASTGSAPGTIVALDEEGVTVATRDGAVRCARARDGGTKATAASVLRALGVVPGARLGAPA